MDKLHIKQPSTQSPIHSRWLILLVMIYLTGWTTTYPMIYKMVEIHHILEPGAIFLFPLSYAISDVIAEVYGYRVARQVVWFAVIAGFFYAVSLDLVAHLPSPAFWPNEFSYDIVFSPILRAYCAATIGSILGAFVNIYMISKYKILVCGRHFWIRSIISTAVGELVFSVVAGGLAFFGVEPSKSVLFLMLDGYLFKMFYAFIAVWPMALLTYYLKKSENIDVYDIGINYNPFKLKLN